MIAESVGPLSRAFSVRHLPAGGADATIEASPEERTELAADLGLPEIRALSATYRVTGSPTHVWVKGRFHATLVQTCVVTLDEFTSTLDQEVAVEFRTTPDVDIDETSGSEHEADLDAPDELEGDTVDLGAITAEFLALSLDPYPRKPDAEFTSEAGGDTGSTSPFSALANLRKP
jgi:uncharacterized metal-binding protein YceD (DUF177 family)